MKYYFGIFSMNLESRMKSLLKFSNTENFTISENNTHTCTHTVRADRVICQSYANDITV